MHCAYPTAQDVPRTPRAEPEMRWVMDFILGVRQIRGEMDIAPEPQARRAAAELPGARICEYLARNRA